jgi:glutathione S-transferase
MSLTLHVGSKGYSSWSLRAYLAIEHARAPYELTTIILDQPETRDQILAVNPTGRVPVLHHDGLVIWDSLAICEYLNELFPAAQLWPADRAMRAIARSISAEMHSSFTAMRSAWAMDLHGSYRGKNHTPAVLGDARRVQTIWRERLAASGGPFLFGAFSIADAMFAPVTTRFTTYGMDMDQTIRGYVETIQALPAFVAWKTAANSEPELHDHK